MEIINSSGIYEKRLKPAHIVMDNGDEKRRKWTRGERERERKSERLLSQLSRR